jgi:carboxymethylenebutenolidase
MDSQQRQEANVAKEEITIQTADGTVPAHLFRPAGAASARQPGVILYMDAFGVRPALDQMAERLADHGYAVLLPDLFYRVGEYGPLDAKTAFSNEATRQKIFGMMGATTQKMTENDSGAFIDTLTKAGVSGNIGTVGYCMGGGRAITAAAGYPDRITAAASFHGGGLASDAPDSPHLRAKEIKARVYVATAAVDGSFPPEQSARLAEAFRTAEVDHAIENYVGMAHGWTVPDNGVFNETGAERHWKRLLTLFDEAVK